MNDYSIPPSRVEPEDPATLPPGSAFARRPAQALQVGDLVLLTGEMFRIAHRRTFTRSPRIAFTLHPCKGGVIFTETFLPREWLPSVTLDTPEEDTRPLPPIMG